jgi:DNA-binding PadR family transcriptional regulator
MADQDLYRGMIRIHVLHHAAKEVVFGLGMMQELQRHGYRIGPGTLYPILYGLEEKGYLRSAKQVVKGKVRKAYSITPRGRRALEQAKSKVRELFDEIFEDDGGPSLSRRGPGCRNEKAGGVPQRRPQ